MSFTIVAAVTPNYAETLRFCFPSWVKNSGASKIIVERIDAPDGPRETAWYDNTALRCEAMCRNVVTAIQAGERVLALDVDCVVLKDLSGGFSDAHPISVARWPDINMGVLFFNPLVDFQFGHFLRRVADLIKANCQKHRGTLRPAGGCQLADQEVWRSMLWNMEERVHKLDACEWNFCPLPGKWASGWDAHKDRVRIVHLKGQGQPERQAEPKRLLQRDYKELL